MLKSNSENIGLLNGNGKGELEGYFLDETYKPNKGDTLYTSGLGGIFPMGIPIGKIVDVKKGTSRIQSTIKVEPFAKLNGPRKVAIVLYSSGEKE
jgi:rod shape-determining protein MreC